MRPHDLDPAPELGELADALLAADGDHVVPAIQRVPDHVLPDQRAAARVTRGGDQTFDRGALRLSAEKHVTIVTACPRTG